MKIAVLGIDLGKNVCSIVGLDASGKVVMRRRVRRVQRGNQRESGASIWMRMPAA